MLRLNDISKEYVAGTTKVNALKKINLSFRKNEFVSILGPSGSGKTTLLNIIGGLDKYTSGDLVIVGKSTKNFNDRDWDIYRNQRIGFIFQSYNLIPHQNVLENVELALTITGIEKKEITRRAKEALDKVGLHDQYYKRPNQLSGGQCQRVAIARALVNDPEILLADEPTGALDTKTSEQIMSLISEIAKEKLVIMVTHNPDIAERYSTRIIRLLDGEITEDSNPFDSGDEVKEVESFDESQINKTTKSKMSWLTAFRLSARNLKSKFKRTLLVAIAGSIGIIGVSTVLSISHGITNYIVSMQDDMLSGNPITIAEEAYDMTALMSNMSETEKIETLEKIEGSANVEEVIAYLLRTQSKVLGAATKNDINPEYLSFLEMMPKEYRASISYNYGIDVTPNFYVNYKYKKSDTSSTQMSMAALKSMYVELLKNSNEQFEKYTDLIATLQDVIIQSPGNEDYIKSQYEVYGNVATKEDEIMLVLDKDQNVTDLTLGQIGFLAQDEFLNIAYKAAEDKMYNPDLDVKRFTYDDLMKMTLTYYPNDVIFSKNALFDEQIPFYYHHINNSFESGSGLTLKVVGVLRPKDNISYGCLTRGFYYTPELTKRILNDAKNSEIIEYMDENNIESFPYSVQDPINGPTYKSLTYYFNWKYEAMNDDGQIETISGMSSTQLGQVNAISALLPDLFGGQKIYTLTKRNLGGEEMPNSIAIYPTDFENKDYVVDYLDKWNKDIENKLVITTDGVTKEFGPRTKVTYTDTLSLIIDMINTLIEVITVALICFTALSLVVSCVMISVITYISVVERIKEIGVIRSLGGRKKDVSHLFNAETFIIGLCSGLIGVGFTYVLSAVLNIAIRNNFGIHRIAMLPLYSALIMVTISVLLTIISGLMPSRKAAKQDPVTALRTE